MHISLTDTLDEYIKSKVRSGLYNNASEVVREALRFKIASEEIDAMKLSLLRETIEPAWQQADKEEFADYSLEKSLNKLRAAAQSNG